MPRPYPNRLIPAETARKYAEAYMVTEDGCWISTYAPMSSGYSPASWRADGKSYSTTVHRCAWTHHNGAIPDGMVIDHKCFNRTCINPEHLRLLTLGQNSQRRHGEDFPLGQCANGHPDSERRTFNWAEGPRWICAQCLKDKNDRTTALRRLELTYGLRLTDKQQAMVDEFMPAQQERAA